MPPAALILPRSHFLANVFVQPSRLLKNSNARGFEGAHLQVRRHKSFIVVSARRPSGRRAIRFSVFQKPASALKTFVEKLTFKDVAETNPRTCLPFHALGIDLARQPVFNTLEPARGAF